MKKQRPILMVLILGLLATASFSNAQVQTPSEARLKQILRRFPQADINKDGKLTVKEFEAARAKFRQALQGNARPAQGSKTSVGFDPGWEESEFPPHAVSLKTPEEIMAIYKRGATGRTYAESADAMSFPKPADGVMRIVGTGHSFTAPGYRTLPSITRAAGFEQPFSLHNGGGRTGSVSYKWEQENGIFDFKGKPYPKLLSSIANAKWEAMMFGPYFQDQAKYFSCWIDFCLKYNPEMKFYISDAWPQLSQLKEKPTSEAFFTEAVMDQLSDERKTMHAGVMDPLRNSYPEKVFVLPTSDAMVLAAKHFLRGELPGVEGIHRVIGRKERSLWRDQLGHLGPGFDRLEGYVFYATLYGKSPELIEDKIDFGGNPEFPSADLDRVFRKIAWQAVANHPYSGVTDKNQNGVNDSLETESASKKQ